MKNVTSFSRVLVWVVGLTAVEGTLAAAPLMPDPRVGPPSSHRNLGEVGDITVSYLEREATWTADGWVKLTAFVDTELDEDRLEVLVDGNLAAWLSGYHRTGPIVIPVSAGTHTIRLQYSKSASTDVGLDLVWVDNVEFVAGARTFQRHTFSTASGDVVPGWTRGGEGGGWVSTFGPEARHAERPSAMAFAGDQATPTSAGAERTLTWPSGYHNELAVSYFVDCEPENDFFRILVNGVEKSRVSGQNKAGRVRIDVGDGEQQVRFEYVKNGSVDLGFDTARVLSVEALVEGQLFQWGGLDGAPVGESWPGWESTSNPTTLSWEVVRPAQPRVIQRPHENAPIIDGALRKEEYRHATSMKLAEASGSVREAIDLKFLGLSDGAFAIGLGLPDQVAEWFMDSGTVTVLADAAPTPLCGSLPGSLARKLELVWDTSQPQEVVQSIGACSAEAPFEPLSSTDPRRWPVEFAMRTEDEGSGAILELLIAPGRPTEATTPLALTLVLDATVPGAGLATVMALPWRKNPAWSSSDTSTWEQLLWIPPEEETVLLPSIGEDGVPGTTAD